MLRYCFVVGVLCFLVLLLYLCWFALCVVYVFLPPCVCVVVVCCGWFVVVRFVEQVLVILLSMGVGLCVKVFVCVWFGCVCGCLFVFVCFVYVFFVCCSRLCCLVLFRLFCVGVVVLLFVVLFCCVWCCVMLLCLCFVLSFCLPPLDVILCVWVCLLF